MAKHTQTIPLESVFDHFVGLALKGLMCALVEIFIALPETLHRKEKIIDVYIFVLFKWAKVFLTTT